MTIAFKTFGCRLNRAEALDQAAALQAAGHQVVELDDPGVVPDCIIVRGCSVTARAQRDCEKALAHLQLQYSHSRILPVGCLPSANPAAVEELLGDSAPTAIPLSTSRAYPKVQDGCSGRCAFCIVPQFRGVPVSVPFGQVLSRARAFLAAGFRELVVTGCNLALYRSEGRGLPALLAALAELTLGDSTAPVHRVRLGSLEPGICDAALVEAFAVHANICRFIHLSLQSGSDAVLARMNRPYRMDAVARFCAAVRSRLGERLALGADVITGFPGETEADFLATRDLVRDFANLHVFPYSERPGTPAATMDGALPRAVRLERARELEAQSRQAREAFARSFLGRTVEVCVEEGGDHGWTAEYLPCRLTTPAPRRSLVNVTVANVIGSTLIALE